MGDSLGAGSEAGAAEHARACWQAPACHVTVAVGVSGTSSGTVSGTVPDTVPQKTAAVTRAAREYDELGADRDAPALDGPAGAPTRYDPAP
jgi:hypothetical protein